MGEASVATLIKKSPVETTAGQLTSFDQEKYTPLPLSFKTVNNKTEVPSILPW